MSENTPALEMRGITKRFPTGTLANEAIELDLQAREIHALLGENGAGKSHPDEHPVRPRDARRGRDPHRRRGRSSIRDPADAIARGIGMVHQHFMLVPVLTVAENVVLGQEITRGGQVLDMRAAEARIKALAERLGFADRSVARASTSCPSGSSSGSRS